MRYAITVLNQVRYVDFYLFVITMAIFVGYERVIAPIDCYLKSLSRRCLHMRNLAYQKSLLQAY